MQGRRSPAGEAGKVSVVAQGQLSRTEGMESGDPSHRLSQQHEQGGGARRFHRRGEGRRQGRGKRKQSDGIHSRPAAAGGKSRSTTSTSPTCPPSPDAGVTYEFQAQTMPADTSSYNTAALKVTQADNNGSAIIGSASNPHRQDAAESVRRLRILFRGRHALLVR